ILIAAPHVGSFCGKYPNDAKGSILHSDNLADRIFVAEQSFGGSLANQSDLLRVANVGLAKTFPDGARPGTNLEVIGSHPHNLRDDVLIARRQLCKISHFRADAIDAGNLLADGLVIVLRQRPGRSESHPEPAARYRSRKNRNHVLSERGDARLQLRLGAVAEADHGNHSTDAKNNS